MKPAPYVVTQPRSRMFYYRRTVPPHLCPFVPDCHSFPGRDNAAVEFKRTLGTTSIAAANQIAAALTAEVDRALAIAKARYERTQQEPDTYPIITPQQASQAIRDWRAGEWDAASLRAFNSPIGTSDRLWNNNDLTDALARYRMAGGDLWQFVPEFDTRMCAALARHGLPISAGHPVLPRLRQDWAEAWLEVRIWEVTQSGQSRLSGFKLPRQPSPPSPTVVATPAEPLAPKPEAPKPSGQTNFLHHIDGWFQSRNQDERGKKSYRADIQQFAFDNGDVTIELVTGKMAQEWVDHLADGGLSSPTIFKKCSALRGYWRWMAGRGFAPDTKPFSNLQLPRESGVDRAKRARVAFRPREIVDLWNRADQDLADVIRLLAYTGARIGSIYLSKVSHIRRCRETGVRYWYLEDKSEAGVRDVPLMPEILPIVDRMLTNKQPDDYLLPSRNKANQYGTRHHDAAKRLSKLIRTNGFDSRYVTHCYRKTVATMFKEAGIDESISAELLGHEHRNITNGIYARKMALDVMLRYMQQAITYPVLVSEPSD